MSAPQLPPQRRHLLWRGTSTRATAFGGGEGVAGRGEDLERVVEVVGAARADNPLAIGVDEDQAEAAPELVMKVAALAEMAADEIEVDVDHLRLAVEVDPLEPLADIVIERVVHQDHGLADGIGGQQVTEVLLGPVGTVVAVDECEVDVLAGSSEARQQLLQQLVAIAGVERDVLEFLDRRVGLDQVERVDMLAVPSDALKRAALGRAYLDRQPWL